MTNPIKFGTDGWRAIIAEDFTFPNVRACARGVADYLKEAGLAERGLIIGYDTRFASEDFAAAAAEVVAANGIKVLLCPKATPTPIISYGVLAHRCGGAIIITASHNPAAYNGFKYKTDLGSSAPDETTAKIEQYTNRAAANNKIDRLPLAEALDCRLVEYIDLDAVYFDQIHNLIDVEPIKRAGLKIVVDSMYGAGCGYLKKLLSGGKTKVIEIDGKRNPLFPGFARPEPIAANLKQLTLAVKRHKASVGLATDGDADRMGIMDENGVFLTQLQVFALLCLYLLEVRGERGAIVKTITTTSMTYRLGELFKVMVFEEDVGFKNVAPVMLRENALIGGEESGGYGFRGHVAERDGILANLYFLDLMVKTGKTPSQLLDYLYRKVGPHYYERVDVTFPEADRQAIISRVRDNAPQVIGGVKVVRLDTGDGFRFILADNSWLLIRFSGTEPVLRVYSETGSTARARRMLDFGRKLAGV
ncbi:MAG: phosphoglucomutase/phosphomannomutase family protein [Dehalococcoidales bacterium]|nr:phosphoglucomutase/phosphomannomutase family protein [Dehalococcoidales bacterium]